ncbi:MAG: hypothetical protein VW667_09035, partial [Candidatus Neomarinimicrobiota bacterium]
AALRSAVENYATQKFLETGRYSYPPNPFSYIEVAGYDPDGVLSDGAWTYSNGTVSHQRRDDNVYTWSYSAEDLTDLDGDDRGANVGLAPENPKDGLSYTVVNGTRATATGDIDTGGSGI